ncbi:MAG: transcriptional regulator [Pseudomonadales bacterium RIFCSPLOWO2_12_60_38]|uniref:WYL domain-containing protein n=3 Tax=Pseudomonas fluorescens group TaxID=136843 RepID=A0A7Y1QP78_9PSED|nr:MULTISPECIES: WYL domain-containing protein [Pseudomonas]OHC33135.1 MAG: transcriptional regulator [Pseudomonadales bacterium RIFCSPLOWO2_12_60_38]OHC42161.1 MAG: transcriptional regulator [Pseudomonadales bacterium RIFCSPLOWO2_12_FULL_59_450]ETK23184.1 transcriptional regulator [Pseudomonas sp. FH1]MBT9304446.1 WYL domain-containing protein [Pseudomonas sp. TAE6080]MCF4981803.1 WYL domain-containing protein [Pseudomonas gessardii]
MKRKQSIEQVRWDLALRYRLIETVAWWEGRLTTGHLIQSFGISRQQASKDINTYITEHAPRNLTYDKQLKGYVPSKLFKPLFIDDSASAYLHLLNQTHSRAPHVEGLALAYAHTMVLEVPDRTIRPEVLRPLLKACRDSEVIEIEYVSLANPSPETRLIAPHTLVYTGMRWHVRAYCEKNREYRDFVLSRLRGQPEFERKTENLIGGDEDWNTEVAVIIEPDSRLKPEQKAIIEADFGMLDGLLVIPTRRALVKYVLQRFQIDPKKLDPKAAAQQIVVKNLDELKPWLYE